MTSYRYYALTSAPLTSAPASSSALPKFCWKQTWQKRFICHENRFIHNLIYVLNEPAFCFVLFVLPRGHITAGLPISLIKLLNGAFTVPQLSVGFRLYWLFCESWDVKKKFKSVVDRYLSVGDCESHRMVLEVVDSRGPSHSCVFFFFLVSDRNVWTWKDTKTWTDTQHVYLHNISFFVESLPCQRRTYSEAWIPTQKSSERRGTIIQNGDEHVLWRDDDNVPWKIQR